MKEKKISNKSIRECMGIKKDPNWKEAKKGNNSILPNQEKEKKNFFFLLFHLFTSFHIWNESEIISKIQLANCLIFQTCEVCGWEDFKWYFSLKLKFWKSKVTWSSAIQNKVDFNAKDLFISFILFIKVTWSSAIQNKVDFNAKDLFIQSKLLMLYFFKMTCKIY